MQTSISALPPPFSSRLRLPEQRPHTVHASSPDTLISEEEEDDWQETSDNDHDLDATPRASAAGLMSRGDDSWRRRLSRDDTANDMHLLAGSGVLPTSSTKAPWTSASEDTLNTLPEDSRSEELRQFRRARKPLYRIPSNTQTHPMVEDPSASCQQPEQKGASLGRRLSKSYEKRFSELRESMQRYALPGVSGGRSRRSSTVNRVDVLEDQSQCIDPTVLQFPSTSPSKRTARQGSERPRKHRHAFLQLGDRKDTPAPAPSCLPVRPASSRFVPAITTAPGGDAARKSAAMHNIGISPTSIESSFDFEEQLCDRDNIYTRNHRLGSIGSANDSGADLSVCYSDVASNYDPRDADGDIQMAEDDQTPSTPTPVHDITKRFPDELSIAILSLLDARDLCHAEQVSKRWWALAKDHNVWREVFLQRYQRHVATDPAPVQVGGAGLGRSNLRKQNWRAMYKARVELEKNWRAGAHQAGKAVYLSGHTDSVYCLQFDEQKIITGSRDRTIRVWDINTYQCIKVIGGPNVKPQLGPRVLRTVDYPSFHMATASVNGTAYGDGIYHVPREWHDASILCLQYDEKILVTGSSDSDLLVWDIETYEPIKRLRKHSGGVLDVALDAKHIVSCSKDSRIIVWDRETYEPKGELTGHRGPVNAVQLRGHLLVSASGDGIARLWDLNQMKLIKEFSAKERGLAAVEFSEDMKYVLAGGNDNITYKFETDTGREVMQFTGHSQLVRSLWLDSANDRVVSGSYDLDLRVYDFVTGQELWRGEEWTTSWMLAAKSDYRRIVATSQDGRILIVDFGIYKGAPCFASRDGQHIKNIDLLRGIEETNEVIFTDPWATSSRRQLV